VSKGREGEGHSGVRLSRHKFRERGCQKRKRTISVSHRRRRKREREREKEKREEIERIIIDKRRKKKRDRPCRALIRIITDG
jgi:hypothetical protein